MSGKPELAERFCTALPPTRIRRPVDGKPAFRSEHQEQSDVISWWALEHKRYALPEFALFAIPNGGARDVITGARLKAEGVRRGALDLMLAKPSGQFSGLFVEMKAGTNGPSEAQRAFIGYLDGAGYKTKVCWSAMEAIDEIKRYLG